MQDGEYIFHGLLHSANLVDAELRRSLAPLAVQPAQARVLHAMDRIGPVSQSDLAAEFGISAASMSTMTDRLLAADYITRAPDPASRRQNVLELTEKGRAVLDGVREVWRGVDDMLRTVLGPDADAFLNQLQRLRDALGGHVPGSPGKTRRAPRPSEAL